ncbi:MAG: hypothetical protein L7F78_11990 [Syntrophales bacterium LBB04]|nr:hypothetical protein [Syntrophales bacterium LBB04]
MVPKTALSLEAQTLLMSIGKKTREIIQKDYPLRKVRNEAIFALGKQGIKGSLLAEITGLRTSSISRIVEKGENRKYMVDRKERELWRLKLELDRLFKRYRSFIRSGKERR